MAVHNVDLTSFRANYSNGLWSCLVQIQSRTIEGIRDDSANPEALQLLRSLLLEENGQASKLAENAQPNQTSLVLFPEYAFGSSQWTEMDTLVRGFSRDLILIATFGASPMACIAQIEAAAGRVGTLIDKGWEIALNGRRPLNFGAVWVKNGDRQTCVLFGKRYAQQGLEATDLQILEFPTSTAIEFEDIVLFPSICADLVKQQTQDGSPSVISEITSLRNPKPAIYTASLLQPSGQASHAWSGAITNLAHSLGQRNAAILLCNVATPKPDNRPGADIWRNLTGIYLSRHFFESTYKACPSFSYHAAASVMGWSVRSWYPQIALGEFRLPPYGATTHLHPWLAHKRLEASGNLDQYKRPSAEEDLLLYCYASGIPKGNEYVLLERVLAHLNTGNTPHSVKLATEFMKGPFYKDVPLAAPLPQNNVESIKQCLQGANALLASCATCQHPATVDWQSHAGRRGQLTIDAKPVAIWASGELSRSQMLKSLRDDTEISTPNDAVTIFGSGKDIGFDQAEWREYCHATSEGLIDDSPFADLSTTAVPPRTDYIRTEDFGRVRRLISSDGESDPAEHQAALDAIIGKCKGQHP